MLLIYKQINQLRKGPNQWFKLNKSFRTMLQSCQVLKLDGKSWIYYKSWLILLYSAKKNIKYQQMSPFYREIEELYIISINIFLFHLYHIICAKQLLILNHFQQILLQSTMKNIKYSLEPANQTTQNKKNKFNNQNQLINQPKSQILNQLFLIQYQTNQQLMTNALLTEQFVHQKYNSFSKISSSQNSTNPSKKDSYNSYTNAIQNKIKIQQNSDAKAPKKSRRKKKQDSSYQISLIQQNLEQNRVLQTKNIPKNYSKMLIKFITEYRNFTLSVLNFLKIDESSFFQFIKTKKNKINTIAELRSIWVWSQSNKYSQALRILSSQCFRKYSLSYIYNSRIEKQKRNVKYRQKMIKVLQKPQQFTQLKDF